METRGKRIKEWLSDAWSEIRKKSIDFAKDEGIKLASDIISNVPFVGHTLSRWIESLREDSEKFIETLVRLDTSEWEKYEETLDRALNNYFQTHEKWIDKKFDDIRNNLKQILEEIKKKDTLKAFRKIEYELRKYDKEIKADFIENRLSGPFWVDFQENYIVEREEVGIIINNFKNGIQFQLLCGDAASGKSVVARQVGYKLFVDTEVFYLNAEDIVYYEKSINEIQNEIAMLAQFKPLLIIDDIHKYPEECSKLFEFVDKNKLTDINILGISRPAYEETFKEKIEENPIDRYCKVKIPIIAKRATDNIIKRYKKVKKNTLKIEEIRTLKEHYEHNLWALMFILDAWGEKKGVDLDKVYAKIAKRLLKLNHSENFGERASDLILCLAAFYQFEFVVAEDFLYELKFEYSKLTKLVKYGHISKLEREDLKVFYGLNHSALAKIYLETEAAHISISKLRKEYSDDWETEIFNKYIQYNPKYSINIVDQLGFLARFNIKKNAEVLLKKIIKKENVLYFNTGIRETEKEIKDLIEIISFITYADSTVGKLFLNLIKDKLKEKVEDLEVSFIDICNQILSISKQHPEIGKEIVRVMKDELIQRVKILKNIKDIGRSIYVFSAVELKFGKKIVEDSKEELRMRVIDPKESIKNIAEGISNSGLENHEAGMVFVNVIKEELKERVKNSKESIGDIGEMIYRIAEVDPESGKEITRFAKEELKKKVNESESLKEIGIAIAGITLADPETGKEFVKDAKEKLEKRVKESRESIKDVCDAISRITKAYPTIGYEIIRNTKEELKKRIKESRESIDVIGHAIFRIANTHPWIGNEIVRDTKEDLKKKAKESKVSIWPKIKSIYRIAEVDSEIGKEIIGWIKEELKEGIKDLQFEYPGYLGKGIFTITSVDPQIGKEITRYAKEELKEIIKQEVRNGIFLKDISIGISGITLADPEIGKEIVKYIKKELKEVMKSRMNDPKHFEDILKTIYFITSADPDVGKELLLVNDEEYQRKLKVTITEKFIPNIKKDLEISPKNKFLSDWLENLQELTS